MTSIGYRVVGRLSMIVCVVCLVIFFARGNFGDAGGEFLWSTQFFLFVVVLIAGAVGLGCLLQATVMDIDREFKISERGDRILNRVGRWFDKKFPPDDDEKQT